MSGISPQIDLRPDHWGIVRYILRWHLPDCKVLAFGSRVGWTAKKYSDLDLAILGDEPQSLDLISALSEAFEESDLPFKVDIVDWALIDEIFRNIIHCNYVTVQDPFVKFGEIATLVRDTILPDEMSNLTYIGLEHIGENSLGLTGTGSAKDVKSTKFRFNKGDILFGKLRPYFRKIIRTRIDGICSTDIWVVRPALSIDPGYLFYLMASPDFVDCAVRGSEGTRMPRAKWEFVARQNFPVPPLPEQRAIAHILGTLDDKIELNRRTNETLEAMARALFKSWFVDFDPVRAKMTLNHSPLEGESAIQERSSPESRWGEQPMPLAENRWAQLKRSYPEKTLNRAKSLRQNRTDAEGLLWHYLRNKQLDGHKFRRQQPVGPYIVDLACLPEKLLIELDGGQHADQETYDEQRDQFLQSQGYRVLRFWNNQVFDNCFAVLEQIYQALNHSPPQHHSPLEGESHSAIADVVGDITPPLRGSHNPQSGFGGGNNNQMAKTDIPPPALRRADALVSPTPPQGGSDWTVERARAYLDRMDPEIADLFPDRLVDSELGEIPEGWETKSLDEIADFLNGLALQKFPASDPEDSLPVIKIAEMRNGISAKSNRASCNIPDRYIVKDGDFLFSWSGSLLAKFWTGDKGALNQHLFKVTSNQYPPWFFSQWIFHYLGGFQTTAAAKATTMGHIQRKHLKEAIAFCPPSDMLMLLDEAIGTLIDVSIKNDLEIHTLAQTRDTLLPKLISGELRVDDK